MSVHRGYDNLRLQVGTVLRSVCCAFLWDPIGPSLSSGRCVTRGDCIVLYNDRKSILFGCHYLGTETTTPTTSKLSYCALCLVTFFLYVCLSSSLLLWSMNVVIIYVNVDSVIHSYETTIVEGIVVKPIQTKMQFRTERNVPKVRFQDSGGRKG